ncbi:hypothetical protein SAMN04487996_109208 [Dyadobacter soli]|uniref:Tetratricopeptide repeat-containing protein n=1 Tax=Dyadobacter soli TaxID=659014 RepID=A0A1G7J7Q7_9BACT|nr:hypothetical protein [Dyadobacter soli]SDF20913.1 hypothetical protein SAMN04487996_109208 [Dyadobacter soli]
MKRLFTFALLFVLATGMVWAQNEKYTKAMGDGINALLAIDRSKPDPKALVEIANRFERIAAAEPKEWLPKYYAAYANVLLGFVAPTLTEKDQYLDKANALLKDAEGVAGKPNDEIEVLKAYQSQIHLAADPMNRWQTDGEKFQGFLQAAKSINAENPRIYYLEASSAFFTPEEYGGGKKVAKPMLEKAQQKFTAFKPESGIHPDWGKMETEWMLSQTN